MPRIFKRLYDRRQKEGRHNKEDYCSELLAVVLDRLNRDCPEEHHELLKSLGLLTVLEVGAPVRWQTQQHRFDILGSQRGRPRIIIEAKKEAPLDTKQLNGYGEWLSKRDGGILCSLTVDGRKAEGVKEFTNVSYVPLSWSSVAGALGALNVGEHLQLLRDETIELLTDWNMSFRALEYNDFKVLSKAASAQQAISFLLSSQYDAIKTHIRSEEDELLVRRTAEKMPDVEPGAITRWRAAERNARIWVGWGFAWDASATYLESGGYDFETTLAFVVAGIETSLDNNRRPELPPGWAWSSLTEQHSYASITLPVSKLVQADGAVNSTQFSDWVSKTYNDTGRVFVQNLTRLIPQPDHKALQSEATAEE